MRAARTSKKESFENGFDSVEGLYQFRPRVFSRAPFLCCTGGSRAFPHAAQEGSFARKEVWFCAEEDKAIDRSDMVKGFETSKGAYVVVEDEELKR